MTGPQPRFDSFVHVLPGDELARRIPPEWGGRRIVFREALIDGPLRPVPDDAFWSIRARYITERYGDTETGYRQKVVQELEPLKALSPEQGICLWFEDDLFCQLNMWCVVVLLNRVTHSPVFRVFPRQPYPDRFGFGQLTPDDLIECLEQREMVPTEAMQRIQAIWEAATQDHEEALRRFGHEDIAGLRGLGDMVEYWIRLRHVREPGNTLGSDLMRIAKECPHSITNACRLFWQHHPHYGLGDLQLINLWKDLGYSWQEITD